MQFVEHINNKIVKELNLLVSEMLYDIFKDINPEDKVNCYKNYKKQKTDIFIKIKNEIKRVSIKTGSRNSVHTEPISEFIHFLIASGIPKKYMEAYLNYHYADGSKNGKGIKRISAKDYKKQHQDKIDLLNNYFNSKELIDKCIERFVLKGRNSKEEIDLLIYGSVNDFFYLKKEEIKDLIKQYKDITTTGLHVGLLFIQPQSRNLNNNPKYEHCRYIVQIKWYNLFDHILIYKNKQISSN